MFGVILNFPEGGVKEISASICPLLFTVNIYIHLCFLFYFSFFRLSNSNWGHLCKFSFLVKHLVGYSVDMYHQCPFSCFDSDWREVCLIRPLCLLMIGLHVMSVSLHFIQCTLSSLCCCRWLTVNVYLCVCGCVDMFVRKRVHVEQTRSECQLLLQTTQLLLQRNVRHSSQSKYSVQEKISVRCSSGVLPSSLYPTVGHFHCFYFLFQMDSMQFEGCCFFVFDQISG